MLGNFFPYSQTPMDKVIRYPVENSQLSNVSPLKRPFHSLRVMFIVSSRSDSSLHPPCKNTSKTYTQTEKRKGKRQPWKAFGYMAHLEQ